MRRYARLIACLCMIVAVVLPLAVVYGQSTEEPTPEVTPEPTSEVTHEATAEATSETPAEAAATSEATAESSMDMSGGGATMTPPSELVLHFAARAGDSDIACGMIYDGLGSAGTTVMVNDFRFYVSNIRVILADGSEVPLELVQDGLWQYQDVALLDFEDGTTTCSEGGNAELNSKVISAIPEGDITGLVFDFGVPFELNHQDTTTAASPLNVAAMWWNWQYGYKFARIDLTTDAELPFFIHLGSTGCESAAPTIAPAAPCTNPNLFEVRFDEFDPQRDFIVLDLASLVATVNLDESVPEPPGCMSMTMDPDCTGIFEGFGLDLMTGLPLEDAVPALFRLQ